MNPKQQQSSPNNSMCSSRSSILLRNNAALSNALEEQSVIAKVIDVDYHRNFAAFGRVDTHYIIQVRPKTSAMKYARFATFRYVYGIN